MKDATCPTFIAAPFMFPSTSTICSAAWTIRRSLAARRPSSERTTFAALFAYARVACPPASPATFAVRWTRPVGIGFSRLAIALRVRARPGHEPGSAARDLELAADGPGQQVGVSL